MLHKEKCDYWDEPCDTCYVDEMALDGLLQELQSLEFSGIQCPPSDSDPEYLTDDD